MLNLLRMDLYRLLRTKAVYICLSILLAAAVLAYWFIWMLDTPDGREFSARIEMNVSLGLLEEGHSLDNYNTLSMFREMTLDGGTYCTLLGLVVSLFVCLDFNSGFIKHIMSLHRKRWEYIASKLLAAGILNFFYMIIPFGFSLLLNVLFHNMVPYAKPTDCLFYLSWAWLVSTAFAALMILISTLTRSTAASVISAIFLGSGILVTFLSYLTGVFASNGWVPYTLYYNIAHGPDAYAGIHHLTVYAVGAVSLTVYSVVSAMWLSRKDI